MVSGCIGRRLAVSFVNGPGELIVCIRNPEERRSRTCPAKNVRRVRCEVVTSTMRGGRFLKDFDQECVLAAIRGAAVDSAASRRVSSQLSNISIAHNCGYQLWLPARCCAHLRRIGVGSKKPS